MGLLRMSMQDLKEIHLQVFELYTKIDSYTKILSTRLSLHTCSSFVVPISGKILLDQLCLRFLMCIQQM